MFKANKRNTASFQFHTNKDTKNRRMWLRYRNFETKLEIFTGHMGPSFKLHFGNKSSETPIDWHICLYWISFFGSFDWPGLGSFCNWLGRGHKRDLQLAFHSGSMWWKVWYDDDMGMDQYHHHDCWKKPLLPPWRWGRKKYRPWMCLRDGNIDLNPLDAIWGSRYYDYETLTKARQIVNIGEFFNDQYLVDFELQNATRSRRYGPKWVRGFTYEGVAVSWKCEAGIPVRNHDWKGDEVYASGFSIPENDIVIWKSVVLEKLKEIIKEERVRYTYVVKDVELTKKLYPLPKEES